LQQGRPGARDESGRAGLESVTAPKNPGPSLIIGKVAMNLSTVCPARPARAALCVASLALLAACGANSCIGLDGCGPQVTAPPPVALSGTAATGRALASAQVSVSCAQGSGTTLTDGGGHYSITLDATLPCIVGVTSGGVTLHSEAFAGGVFNVTPETELMLVYLAAQLGTSESGLITGLPGNAKFQQALANADNVTAAQSAVVANLQTRYGITLTVPSFLSTPFTVGQAGIDSDLVALANAGAIDASGLPDPAAVSLMTSAGAAHPLATPVAASATAM
jgi:hypothetical protein